MEYKFSRVFKALPGLVWTALLDGQIDFRNFRWRENSGLCFHEARCQGWLTAIHVEDLLQLANRR
jgi:hypothetical protein